jgi:transcriptional regulator with XRE-family HTH domain
MVFWHFDMENAILNHKYVCCKRAYIEGEPMITATQLRAARALLGVDQRQLADLSGLSLPTIQRMEGSEDLIRCNVDSLMKLIDALEGAGVEVINDGAVSQGGGRGVRLKASRKALEVRGRNNPTVTLARASTGNRVSRSSATIARKRVARPTQRG